ncbi:MAG: 4-(cytidine 5'-diphospho)-2-C-methyl-D-erythritol kinase, partial [Candidatus Binataceae bacterium]
MVRMLSGLAPAKINLFLRVVGRRPDGFHQLDSVFLPISIHDRIAIEIRPSRAGSITLKCDRAGLPLDERNLAVRAARAFMNEFGVAAEASIGIHKEIPVGAGLGGGSSDAGAVLRMMAALYRIEAVERLFKLALALGADVPFFIDPRPARIGGIGERIAPLGPLPRLDLVLAVPPFEVLTAEIFRALARQRWSGPASDAELDAIASGAISPAMLVNDLAPVAIARYPEIGRLKTILLEAGARGAAMTGSGGAVFGIFGGPE